MLAIINFIALIKKLDKEIILNKKEKQRNLVDKIKKSEEKKEK